MNRRQWMKVAGLSGMAAWLPGGCARRETTPAVDPEPLLRFPGKVAMRAVNDRPPCLETAWRYYREDFTPNEAFYVRWHLQAFPTSIDLRSWRLRLDGHVEWPLEFSMDELRRMEPVSIAAVNQCSGNSRSLFGPRVPGAQWRNGAMGNARWTGVRLADLLAQAGLKAGAVDVVFDGLDEGPLASVPDFVKSLAVDHASQSEVLIAYEMNGEPLPVLNGFPVRLIVPGWYATYWVKALHRITVLPQAYDGYWMAKAYKIPTAPQAAERPDALAKELVPINRMNVRSFFTLPEFPAVPRVGQPISLEGIAFDGGSGISLVEVSTDAGRQWQAADLADDHGRFSFRRWRLNWTPSQAGEHRLLVRATNRDGDVQPSAANWNRAGYMRNVIEETVESVI
jgi:DMSO/TMAO reductase YedYZ molybdopterin-dependent catalytic subunit